MLTSAPREAGPVSGAEEDLSQLARPSQAGRARTDRSCISEPRQSQSLARSAGPPTSPGIRSGGGPRIAGSRRRLAYLGVGPADSDTIWAQNRPHHRGRPRHRSRGIWVGTYWILQHPAGGSDPVHLSSCPVATLVIFARTKSYWFRAPRNGNDVELTFLLQWTLGGPVASSAVSLWALIAAFGTLFYFTTRESIPWFVAFLAWTAVSGLLEPILSRSPAAIPEGIRTAFVPNVSVSVTAYVLLQYAVQIRDEAFARSDRLC